MRIYYKVEAYIKPFLLDKTKEGLVDGGFVAITASEVRGFGRQRGHTEMFRGSEYTVDFLPKIKLEVVVEDLAKAQKVKAIIEREARTGQIGDGKVFIAPVYDVTNIRDGQPYEP